jgi:large subunit ribosomal protein L35Ae
LKQFKREKRSKKVKEDKLDCGSKLSFQVLGGKNLSQSRSKVAQNTNQNILSLEGVNNRNAAQYYYGKRVAYIYKRTSGQKDKRFKVNSWFIKTIWGRISRSHGNNGSVLARFNKNLSARAMGSTLRVMLFPQRG